MPDNEFTNDSGDEAWAFGFRFTIEPPRRTLRQYRAHRRQQRRGLRALKSQLTTRIPLRQNNSGEMWGTGR